MTAAGARLVSLSGLSGVSAGAHLAAIGAGTTAGSRLAAWSGLSGITAAAHLLTDHDVPPIAPPSGGGSVHAHPPPLRLPKKRRRPEAALFALRVL